MTPSVMEFRELVEAAPAVLLRSQRSAINTLWERLALVENWWVDHDLLSLTNPSYGEDPETELLAWALHPDTDPPTAHARQRAWLDSVGIEDTFEQAVVPVTQVPTPDSGVPDMLLDYGHFAVVVEAKTHSPEHYAAQTGLWQTVAYPPAIRRMLARSDLRVHMVFLTPDGKPAKNPEALLATWIRSALALAHAFQPSASTVQHAFGNLLTHFLNNGPGTAKLTMRRVREFRAAVPKPTDAQLLAQFGLVEAALRLLTPVLYEDTMSDRDPEDFFSEAAVLYASNTTVIEALETECRDRTKALCGAVRRELLGRMPGVDLDLAGKAWPKGGDLYLWFDRADPLILGDVRLQVTVYKTERVSGEAALESGRRAVEAAGASTVDVAPSTSAQKVMTVDVPFSKTNPVQSLADRLERLLRGLAE